MPHSMLHPGVENPGAPIVLESPHPYRDNSDIRQLISVPGATSLSISFDKQSSMEMTHDFVRFYHDDDNNNDNSNPLNDETYGEIYTGGKDGSRKNYPGCNGIAPLVIPSDRVIMHFFRYDCDTNRMTFRPPSCLFVSRFFSLTHIFTILSGF